MKLILKSILVFILRILNVNALLIELKEQERQQLFFKNAMYNKAEVVINSDAKIVNLQNDKSKITIGNQSHVYATLLVFFYGGEIKIGKNSYIGDGVRIWSGEKITIGNDVIIGHNTNIIDTNSHETDMQERQKSVRKQLELGYQKEKGNIETAPIIIKDNVWISYGVSILKGITIGEGAIIAANSVVTKNVEPFTLVAGNPAVFIKKISNETAAN